MQYDGTGKLAEAIAALYGLSPKSQERIAKLIKQAKDELGIVSKAKVLPDDTKLAIWRWHYERLNPVYDVKQDEGIQVDNEKPVPDSVVYDVKQTDGVQDNPVQSLHDTAVQDVKQTKDDKPEVLPDSTVQNIKQAVPVQDDVIDESVYDFKQIHFAVAIPHNGKPKRTTVMLEGYLVKALQRKHGLTDNAAIRAWIEQAIKSDGVRFDSRAPLTRQLKRVIIESFV